MKPFTSQFMISTIDKARSGDLEAIDLAARRYFKGTGVEQSFQIAYYWSAIGVEMGMPCLLSIEQFSLNNLSEDEKLCVKSELKNWYANPSTKNAISS